MIARFLVVLSFFFASVAAHAGEDIVFADSPKWAEPVDLEAAIAKGEQIVLYDRQVRFEDEIVHRYTDSATKVRSTDDLDDVGTIKIGWSPDKGDLIVHRLNILRGDQVIDVMESGGKFEVIRREARLENRALDGRLTAVMTVPALEVGDILRLTTTITIRDQALDGQMQASEGFYTEPHKLGFGRVRLSHPRSLAANWQTIGQAPDPVESFSDGFRHLEILMPIAAPKEMPEDAPGRFTVGPLIRLSSYANWQELAQNMAPLYATKGTVAPGGDIAAEVARIKAATTDDLERAALAVRLVQDEVSYLLNGLDGGNYLPQSPAETWELRYGDCKAKTLLLLAILDELGISAVPVLVHTERGDAASIAQAQPSVFNHIVAKATIGGEEFWLDGTSSGTRINTVHEVPDFGYGLVLADGVEGLTKLTPRLARAPNRIAEISYDLSAGVDMPVPFEIKLTRTGSWAAEWRSYAALTGEVERYGAVVEALEDFDEDLIPFEGEFSFDEETASAVLTARGMTTDLFNFRRDEASLKIPGDSVGWEFRPDRARREWREIPFGWGGPSWVVTDVSIKLPSESSGQSSGEIRLTGDQELDTVLAGIPITRTLSRADGIIRMRDSYRLNPIELDSAAIRKGRRDIRSHASKDPKLTFTQPLRRWQLSDEQIGDAVDFVIEGFVRLGALVETDAQKSQMIAAQGMMAVLGRQNERAIALLSEALAIEETDDALDARATLYLQTRDYEKAASDLERAYDLSGDLDAAIAYARALVLAGQGAEALELLDTLALGGAEGRRVTRQWAYASGAAGQLEEGWLRLDDALLEEPDDRRLLNAQCWFMGIWSYDLENAMSICEEAVSQGNTSASSLDSRALVKYRLGDFEGAMADYNLALEKSPAMSGSLYMRGVIKHAMGDDSWQLDITHALRMDGYRADQFAIYGIEAPR